MVADLEYTSWEGSLQRGWSRPDEHREIVQIGAIRLNAGDGFAETGALDVLVQPQRNPVLSDYFVELTGITNARLASEGTELAAALEALKTFAAGATFWSNGSDDAVIAENCALVGIENPVANASWRDIALPFARLLDREEQIVSADVPEMIGLPAPGHAHDALSDVRAIALGLRHLRKLDRL